MPEGEPLHFDPTTPTAWPFHFHLMALIACVRRLEAWCEPLTTQVRCSGSLLPGQPYTNTNTRPSYTACLHGTVRCPLLPPLCSVDFSFTKNPPRIIQDTQEARSFLEKSQWLIPTQSNICKLTAILLSLVTSHGQRSALEKIPDTPPTQSKQLPSF